MIPLSNGRTLEHVVPSGAMGFNCKGWFWEWPLVWTGLIKLEWFTTFFRTLTKNPRPYPISNLSWMRPWTWLPFSPYSCVRTIPDGSVNKIGLWNPGIDYWCKYIAPHMDFKKYPIGGSIYGNGDELVEMAERLNEYDLVALEINDSCPNIGYSLENVKKVVANMKCVAKVSRHPPIAKLSVAQNYLAIAEELAGIAQAISLNSVLWEIAFPSQKSPLSGIGGTDSGGGVSGKPAQKHNWAAVEALAKQGAVPVIAPSIMEYADLERTAKLGAKAWSFGAIHLPSHPFWRKPWTLFTNPCKPTAFVKKVIRLT